MTLPVDDDLAHPKVTTSVERSYRRLAKRKMLFDIPLHCDLNIEPTPHLLTVAQCGRSPFGSSDHSATSLGVVINLPQT